MYKTILSISSCLLAAAVVVTNSGCFGSVATQGPYLGIAAVPIPVSPYFQKKREDKFHAHERYDRATILGPITAGGPAIALDEPSDDEVMTALEKARPVQGGIPLLWERQRNNVRIVKEKIADYVDPPRIIPLIGPAQLHHAHYKCTIYFSERTIVGWPIPHWLEEDEASEVIYIDHNHFHMVGHTDPGVGSPY